MNNMKNVTYSFDVANIQAIHQSSNIWRVYLSSSSGPQLALHYRMEVCDSFTYDDALAFLIFVLTLAEERSLGCAEVYRKYMYVNWEDVCLFSRAVPLIFTKRGAKRVLQSVLSAYNPNYITSNIIREVVTARNCKRCLA